MRRRPLVIVVLAFITGIILGGYCISNFFLLLALAAFFLSLTFILQRISQILSQATLIAAIIATGALLYNHSRLPAEALYSQSLEWGYVQGVVVNYPTSGLERTSFVLKPRDSLGYLQIFYFHPARAEPLPIAYSDELRIYSQVEWPEEIDGFNYREYLLQRDIWGTVAVWSRREIKLVAPGQGNPILAFGYRTREKLFRFIDRHISHSEAQHPENLLKALLFGERGHLEEEVEAEFRDAGVAHILAVSGLHLGIIVGLLWFALRAVRLSTGKIYLVLIPVVGLYLLVVGFRVSLVRAAIMFAFLALGLVLSERGLILRRWADPYQGLSAAALVILAWEPQALFDVSFQLSFSATLGIIFFTPKLDELLKLLRPRWLRELIVVSLAAQLGVIPFIAWHFQRVYLLALFANLIVIPLVTLVMWGGIAFLLLPLPYLVDLLGRAEGWLLNALDSATGFLAGLRFAYLGFGREWLALVLSVYLLSLAGLVAFFVARSRRGRQPSPAQSR
jgi:competence protein ComEC